MPPHRRLRATFATLVAGAAALAAGTFAARGGVVEHDTIASGDTVLGDLLAPGDVDVYDFDAPRGATVVLAATPAPPGRWTASTIGVLDFGYTRALAAIGTGPTTVRTEPLSASGTWHLAVGTGDARLGGYRVRLTVVPARTFATGGTGDGAAAPFTIGAPAGAELTVKLRWRGALPVTLDPDAGISGPGSVLVASAPPKSRKSSSTQSGFRTAASGDHVVRFAVPAGTTSWTAKVSVKPPRPARGTTRDLRAAGPPAPHTLTLVDARDFVAIRVADEDGGPNDVALLPTSPQAGQGSVHPAAIGIDGRGTSCTAFGLDRATPPGTYRFVCASGSIAEMRDVVRSGERIVAFDAPIVRSPAGTGRTSVAGVTYDAALRPVAWTETRTFDATGHVHVLAVSGVTRRADGAIIGYTVVHTDPAGNERTYSYALLQTR